MSSKRLVFDDSQHCGRTEEVTILTNAFSQLSIDHDPEIVLVKGFSGTGKSTVASEFRHKIQKDCYFVSGKYDESVQQDPFAVIFGALEMLCSQILEKGDAEVDRLRARIHDSAKDELSDVLTPFVPNLAAVLGSSTGSIETDAPISGAVLSVKVKYLFVKLLQCLSTEERPVVLFLDDLQWINRPSLDLLQILLTDAKLADFMFVGSYRCEAVDDNNGDDKDRHILHNLFSRLEEHDKTYTTIQVENLSFEDVCNFVARVLDAPNPEAVTPLAESLYQKTQGNAFYIKSYLQLLVEKEILTFSYSSYEWSWDLQRLEGELDLSDNVVAIVLAKLQGLDESLQTLMMIASSLPSTFGSSFLKTLLERCGKDSSNLEQKLEVLVLDGFLVNVIGTTRYRFAHDRIQQASMEFLSGKELNKEVGTILAEIALGDDAEDWMIFASIDHLESCRYGDRAKMIQYYTIAAQRSARIAAYGPAAIYYGKAISLMRGIDAGSSQNMWQSRSEQCLELFLAATEVEFTLGNFERGNAYCQELLSNSASESHNLRANIALLYALAKRQQSVLAINKARQVLRSLGEYPRNAGNPIDMLVRLMMTKSKLRRMPVDEILSLPLATDTNFLLAMRTLDSLIFHCYSTGKIVFLLQTALHMINLSLQKGLTRFSATAFITLSTLTYRRVGDEKFGKKLKEIAVVLFHKVPGSNVLVPILAASDVDSWYVPLNTLRKTLDDAFEYAMSSGDSVGGALSYAMNVLNGFFVGFPLDVCCAESAILLTMLRQYSVESLRVVLKPFDKMLHCLTGEIKDPKKWVTDFEIPNKKRIDRNQIPEIVQGCLGRSTVAYCFRSYDEAERYIEGTRQFADYAGGFHEVVSITFFGPLTYMARYRQTKRRKYHSRAKGEHKKLQKMVQQRGLNIVHKFYIVDAEYAATFGKNQSADDIKAKYEKAIAASRKPGYV